MIITDPLRLYAYQDPHKPAVVVQNMRCTYHEIHELVNKIANSLLSSHENKAHDQYKVALLLDNSIEFLLVFLASAKIGWLTLIMDPKWSRMDIVTILTESDPDILVIQDVYINRLKVVPQKMKLIIVPSSDNTTHNATEATFAELLQGSTDEPKVQIIDSDPFFVGYTSGTTGKPKGFLRSHRSWVVSFHISNAAFHVNSHSHVLAPGSLVHSLSLYAAISTLFTGATFYMIRKFNASQILELLSSNPISHIYLVPTIFEALFREQELLSTPTQLHHIQNIISTGDKWSPSSKQRVKSIFPTANLFEFYGASELSFVTILDPEGNSRRPDSVGRAAHTVRISLRDESGREVKRGETGQLYVQSDMLFSGYYLNPDETREILQDGWATVGDLAREDDEGFIYIVGRKKNMIISGGLNIYPEEIERVLLRLPHIDEAMVLGIPDYYWGEKVVAFITFKPGLSLREDEIKAYCKEHLATYKCPQEIVKISSFPHTVSGKISREVMYKEFGHRRSHNE